MSPQGRLSKSSGNSRERAIPALIEHLADDDQQARALIHLFSLIDKTSDQERNFVINTAIEQAYARADGSESIEAI
jgi:hypothetical protein